MLKPIVVPVLAGWLIAAGGLFVSVPMAIGQDAVQDEEDPLPAARRRIEELEKQVQQLRAELAMIRNDRASPKPQPPPADDAEQPDTGPAPAEPAADAVAELQADPPEQSEPRAYMTFEPILRDLPADLQPKDGQWPELRKLDVQEQFRYAYWNRRFNGRLTVNTIDIQPNRASREDATASPFTATIGFDRQTLDYRGTRLVIRPSSETYFIDERTADRLRKLKQGQELRVNGVIRTIDTRLLFVEPLTPDLVIEWRSLRIPEFNIP